MMGAYSMSILPSLVTELQLKGSGMSIQRPHFPGTLQIG